MVVRVDELVEKPIGNADDDNSQLRHGKYPRHKQAAYCRFTLNVIAVDKKESANNNNAGVS